MSLQDEIFKFRENVFYTLLLVLAVAICVQLVQYHWSRIKLYKAAAQIPGPFPYPIFGNAFKMIGRNPDYLRSLMELCHEYKSPVRCWFGNKLYFLCATPEHFEAILNNPHSLEKSEIYKFTKFVLGNGLVTADVPTWKKHRKLITPTFNQKVLDGFVEIFANKAEILAEQLKRCERKGFFDVFMYISKSSLDIICETALGIDVQAQTTNCNYMNWVNRGMEIVTTQMATLWYHSEFIFNLVFGKELTELKNNIQRFTTTVVKQRKAEYAERVKERPETQFEDGGLRPKTTFLERLIELSEKEGKLSVHELGEEVDTFVIAGSDTTALIESYTLMMIGMHQDIQEKVYQEVMDTLGPDRKVEYSDIAKFTYMERVIKEVLRIFPTGAALGRLVTADIQLDEKLLIPAGSNVILNTVALHRNPEYWPDPLKFDPDRFLPEEIAKRHPYSWVPFSGGPRNCIGIRYAMMAMKTVIATLIRKYKIRCEYKKVEDIRLKLDVLTRAKDGYKISLELREQ